MKDFIVFLNNCFILSLALLVWCGFCPSLLGLKSCLKFITRHLFLFTQMNVIISEKVLVSVNVVMKQIQDFQVFCIWL